MGITSIATFRSRVLCACAGAWLTVGALTGVRAADVDIDVVPIPVASGKLRMTTGVFRPGGNGPFPLVVYSHGRSGNAYDRSRTGIPDVRSHVRYWLGKGFAVIAPIRPGYGATGGEDREASGVRYDVFGNCWGPPDFAHAASSAADAVLASLAWARQQPWVDRHRVVLVGTSMGGLASVATAAANPQGVVAFINFAGGTGGDGGRAPGRSCGSEDMAALLGAFGRSTQVPSLWLYASNDSYWGAEWPRAWHRAFAAGGSATQFVMTDPVPNADGHALLARGARLWMPHVDRFLDAVVFGKPGLDH
jgi:dienelactone hydrolase